MIDYYENVDFEMDVWLLQDGALERQTLRDVCRDHGDDDGKYASEGRELVEYAPNYQQPRRVMQRFDTDAEADHAYWLLLCANVHDSDVMPEIIWEWHRAKEAVWEQIEEAEDDVRDRVRYSEGNTEWANSDGHGEKVAYWTAQLEHLEANH